MFIKEKKTLFLAPLFKRPPQIREHPVYRRRNPFNYVAANYDEKSIFCTYIFSWKNLNELRSRKSKWKKKKKPRFRQPGML